MFLYKVFNHPCCFFHSLICVVNKELELAFASLEPGTVFVLSFDELVAVGLTFGGAGLKALDDFVVGAGHSDEESASYIFRQVHEVVKVRRIHAGTHKENIFVTGDFISTFEGVCIILIFVVSSFVAVPVQADCICVDTSKIWKLVTPCDKLSYCRFSNATWGG